MSTVVRVAVLGLLLTCFAVPAAKAQDTGTYRSGPVDWGLATGVAWVDFNADGKADFCRVNASSQPLCTLATGRRFGATIVGGMLLSPICSLLVIPTVARLMMREVAGTTAGTAKAEPEPA